MINVQNECIGLLQREEIAAEHNVHWPAGVDLSLTFAINTRGGRTYFMFADKREEYDRWITAIEALGANIRCGVIISISMLHC